MRLLIDLRHAAVPMLYSQIERVDHQFSVYPPHPADSCPRCNYLLCEHLWQLFDAGTVVDCEVA